MKEKKQFASMENIQLWADLHQIISVTYSVEITLPNAYFREYSNYPQYNYWEWFVIPGELIFKPAQKIIFKSRVIKTYLPKKKPLLFCKPTIVPLRI